MHRTSAQTHGGYGGRAVGSTPSHPSLPCPVLKHVRSPVLGRMRGLCVRGGLRRSGGSAPGNTGSQSPSLCSIMGALHV